MIASIFAKFNNTLVLFSLNNKSTLINMNIMNQIFLFALRSSSVEIDVLVLVAYAQMPLIHVHVDVFSKAIPDV